MKNEPKIRIKGFEGEWKTSKLSTFAKRVTRKNGNLETELPVTISSQDGIIAQTQFFNSVVASSNLRGYYLIKKGEFAYNKSYSNGYPYGSVKRLEKYDMGALSTLYIVFALSKDIDHDYVIYFFETMLWHNEVAMRAAEGARNHGLLNIGADNFLDIQIIVPPTLSEQRKLASFFRHLDSLIETADKKVASLKQVKEASLQSMFPKKGQKVPEVRFKGFEGEWKTTLLKEISQKVVEKNVKLQYKITLTNSAEYGIIDQLDFFDHKISNNDNIRNYYIVRDRDFVYNPRISTSAPVGPINQNLLGYVGIMSPLYYVFRIHNIDECYLRYFFKTKLWHTFMKDNGNSGARFDRLSITDDIFEKMPIIHPADKAEQRKIASFFVHLDKQIAIAQQRLDLLRRIKSACLDEMFV